MAAPLPDLLSWRGSGLPTSVLAGTPALIAACGYGLVPILVALGAWACLVSVNPPSTSGLAELFSGTPVALLNIDELGHGIIHVAVQRCRNDGLFGCTHCAWCR